MLTVSLTVYALISVVVLFFADTFDKILSFTIFLVQLDAGVTLMALRQNTTETSLDVEALRNSRTVLSWDRGSEYQVSN